MTRIPSSRKQRTKKKRRQLSKPNYEIYYIHKGIPYLPNIVLKIVLPTKDRVAAVEWMAGDDRGGRG